LVPGKGKILNQLSAFWFRWMRSLGIENHFITDDVDAMDVDWATLAPPEQEVTDHDAAWYKEYCRGRSMLCIKTEVYPIEAIVRDFLVGSGWKEYQAKGTLAGLPLPANIPLSGKLPNSQFTPSTKAESGHDVNITFEEMQGLLGGVANRIRDLSLSLFTKASEYAKERGIIIADTKFEWGWTHVANDNRRSDRNLWLIDEVLTPDSSRFWDAATYEPGKDQPSLDKDNVRRYYKSIGFTGDGDPPPPPADVIEATRKAYIGVFTRLVGKEPVL